MSKPYKKYKHRQQLSSEYSYFASIVKSAIKDKDKEFLFDNENLEKIAETFGVKSYVTDWIRARLGK